MVTWDSKCDLFTQRSRSSPRSCKLVHSDKLSAVVKGERMLLKHMFQKIRIFKLLLPSEKRSREGKAFHHGLWVAEMKKSLVPPKGEAEFEQQSQTDQRPGPIPGHGQRIAPLPSPHSLPKKQNHTHFPRPRCHHQNITSLLDICMQV